MLGIFVYSLWCYIVKKKIHEFISVIYLKIPKVRCATMVEKWTITLATVNANPCMKETPAKQVSDNHY